MNKNSFRLPALLLLAMFAASPAIAGKKARQLQESMDAYAAAIRWGNFDQARQFVDPAWQQAHPPSNLELQRYAQVDVSGYTEQGSTQTQGGDVLRNVELRVINKHTQVERIVRYTEHWHYDKNSQRWWESDGLPDLWAGE